MSKPPSLLLDKRAMKNCLCLKPKHYTGFWIATWSKIELLVGWGRDFTNSINNYFCNYVLHCTLLLA